MGGYLAVDFYGFGTYCEISLQKQISLCSHSQNMIVPDSSHQNSISKEVKYVSVVQAVIGISY